MKQRCKSGKVKWNPRNIKSFAEKFFIKVLENNNLSNYYNFNHPVKVLKPGNTKKN